MTSEIIELVTTGFASLGGGAALSIIIGTLIKTIGAYKTTKAANNMYTHLEKFKDEIVTSIINYFKQTMTFSLDVDITAQVREIVNEIFGENKNQFNTIVAQLNAMKTMHRLVADRLLLSNRVSPENRAAFLEYMEKCDELIQIAERGEKPKVQIKLEAIQEPATQIVEKKNKKRITPTGV